MSYLVSFITLAVLEIVLGIDNIIFISILVAKLPREDQAIARRTGLILALFFRIILLFFISWIAGLTDPWFTVFSRGVSGRDLILIGGGLFLVAKSTSEIHEKLEVPHEHEKAVSNAKRRSLFSAIVQIILLDIIFSIDSVVTAVGLAQELPVMIAAVVVSVLVMMATAGSLNEFIERHPTIKMLALSFLLMVGVVLFVDGLGVHVPKGYIYFAMAFSVLVEMLNIRLRSRSR